VVVLGNQRRVAVFSLAATCGLSSIWRAWPKKGIGWWASD
jgi:hypothetical protein